MLSSEVCKIVCCELQVDAFCGSRGADQSERLVSAIGFDTADPPKWEGGVAQERPCDYPKETNIFLGEK